MGLRLTTTGWAILSTVAAVAAFFGVVNFFQMFPRLCPPSPLRTEIMRLPLPLLVLTRAMAVDAADVVVRARVESVEATGAVGSWSARPVCWGYYPHVRVTLRVSEYLRGEGEGIVELLIDEPYVKRGDMTMRQAEASARRWLGRRDRRWDSGESIVFLQRGYDGEIHPLVGTHPLVGKIPLEFRLPSAGGGRFYAESPSTATTTPPTMSLDEIRGEIDEAKRRSG